MARFSARTWQNCATCQFWLGPRTLNTTMVVAEVEESAGGTCTAKGIDSKSYATTSCIGWRRWLPLEPNMAAASGGAPRRLP